MTAPTEPLLSPDDDDVPLTAREEQRAASRELFRRLNEISAELAHSDPALAAERQRVRDELVELHLPLVEHLARRFRNRGEPLRRPGAGRHHRPDQVRRPVRPRARRRVLDLRHPDHRRRDQAALPRQGLGGARAAPAAGAAALADHGDQELSQSQGRAPTVAELAEHLEISEEEVLEGLESANAYATLSLDAPATAATTTPGRRSTPSAPRTRRSRASSTASRSSRCWTSCPPREKTILLLRFFGNMTQ